MNAKDLLQMNEQMIAFNALIKGDLANEVSQAKAALDALGDAQAIAGAQAKVDSDIAGFEAYKVSVQAVFDETKAELQTAQEQLAVDQAVLSSNQQKLASDQVALAAGQAQLETDKAAAADYFAQQQASITEQVTQVQADQATATAVLQTISDREALVAAKLSAIQAAAKLK